ncbi:MAG: glycoside hydrolase family 3 C-terminal domain-containing protein [Chitinophagales bacterium]
MSQTVLNGNPFHNAEAVAYANSKTEAILPQLTLKEKVGQMNTQGHFFARAAGAMLFGKGLPLMTIGENKKYGIPGATFTDGPRGVVRKYHTNFPCAMARAASWDVELEESIGQTMGKDAIHSGANLIGTPCMNILYNPLNGRAQEAYGEDPYLTGFMACALSRGIQSCGVMATAKHYALNSIENSRFTINVKVDKRTLHEVYMPHFKMLIEDGCATVMSAYNKVNGKYCGENEVLLNDILRKQWGFKGFVHSDWILGTRSTVDAVKAGMNVEMPNPVFYSLQKIKKAIKEGKLDEADIDALIKPTLFTKYLFQYIGQQMPKADITYYKPNSDLAYKAAEESAVLLKNENKLLPLAADSIKTIALVGYLSDKPNDGDRGSSYVRSGYVLTPLQAFKEYCGAANIQLLHATGKDAEELKAVCEKADAVIVVAGVSYEDEGEFMTMRSETKKPGLKSKYLKGLRIQGGGDRETLSLSQRDIQTIETAVAANPKTTVMLSGGSAITMEEWKNKVPAILMTWYHGMDGAYAMPKLLFGDANPSGKLPFTIPVNEADLPEKPFAPDSITYGYYHGYTLLDKKNIKPAFPFGYGLSYTDFEIGEAHLNETTFEEKDTISVKVIVKNTGKCAGKEVVQVYVGCNNSKVDRPVKVLRTFKKVELLYNEQKEVTLTLPVSSLAYFDESTDGWKLEKTEHTLYVGNSSANDKLQKINFRVN